jgi:signal transduction histidine kinase/ActR/RegA family two-component response regulator
MTLSGLDSSEERALVLLAPDADAALANATLSQAGQNAHHCADMDELCRELDSGVGMILVSDEVLDPLGLAQLVEALSGQPPWSDIPVIALFQRDSRDPLTGLRMLDMLEPLGDVTVLERPVRTMALASALKSALRARHRQYQVRNLVAELSDKVRQRDEFLSRLAHDVRNPLSAIVSASEILDQFSGSPDLVGGPRSVIARQARQLSGLIDNVMNAWAISTGKVHIKPVAVDLEQVARRALQAQLSNADAQRVSLTMTTEERPQAAGDAVRLGQIIAQLLENAVKFTPAGGKVELSVGQEDDQAFVRVRDTGSGIHADMLPNLFGGSPMPDRGAGLSENGMGIGLRLVRHLVELHHGQVTARSTGPGKGSEFTVRLPLWSAPAAAPATARQPHLAVQRVLIVEDNRDGRETLRQLLQLWGYQVEVAADGKEGVARALAGRPDVALVDIGLPVLDGYQVARQLRSSLGNSIFLSALTGYGQPEDRRRAFEAGFDAHMVKPVDPDELSRLLLGARSGSHPLSEAAEKPH